MAEFVTDGTQKSLTEVEAILGNMIGDMINEQLLNGSLSYEDSIVLQWIPCVLAEGNIEFLKSMASSMYSENNKEVILGFLDRMIELRNKGAKELHKER